MKLRVGLNRKELGIDDSILPDKITLDVSTDKLKIILDALRKKRINITKEIFDLLSQIPQTTIEIDPLELEIESIEYKCALKEDQKKVILEKLKNIYGKKYSNDPSASKYQKDEYITYKIRKLHENLAIVKDFQKTIDEAVFLGLNPIISEYCRLFFTDRDDLFIVLQQAVNNEFTDMEQQSFKNICNDWGISEEDMKVIFYDDRLSDSEEENYNGKTSDIVYEDLDSSKLNDIRRINGKGFVDFNLFLFALELEGGINFYGKDKFKEYYTKYFLKIANLINNGFGGDTPDTYKIIRLNSSKISKNEAEEKSKAIHQHMIRRELDGDFEEKKDLLTIGSLFKHEKMLDLNLSLCPYNKFPHKSIKIFEGNIHYTGLFVVNSGFENTNIIVEKDIETGKRYLRLSIAECGQDDFIFFVSQISYYLKHKRFFKKEHLFSEIYKFYNILKTENSDIFDIDIFGDAYEAFITDIVRPLSKEYHNEYGEKDILENTLILGNYGSGKTQFMLNLMHNNKFKLDNVELETDAIFVNISAKEFEQIVGSDISVYKKRLSEIYENTGKILVLIIEDLDTILNENGNKGDAITQAITELLQGIGNIPIKIITSTNYPISFPERLTRPFRIDNHIVLDLPLSENIRQSILKAHINKYDLNEIFDENLIQDFLKKTERYTSSHLALFIFRVHKHIIKKKKFKGKDYEISESEISDVFKKVKINIEDIKQAQKELNLWLKSKDPNRDGATSGFITNKISN